MIDAAVPTSAVIPFLEACAEEWEAFVDADKAAEFLGVNRRHLLSMARAGIRGAYPIGTDRQRNTWVFRRSELAQAVIEKRSTIQGGSLR